MLNQQGTTPDDNIHLDAMTLANMQGEHKTYSWEDGPPKAFDAPEDINIQRVNLKSEYKPFIIFEPGPKIKPFSGSVRPEYAHFPWWNHWPVAQLPNDGRKAFGPDRPSHSSLAQSVERSQVIHNNKDGSYSVVTLIGMTDEPVTQLALLARSWNQPPDISIESSGFSDGVFSKKQRAFLFKHEHMLESDVLKFNINATKHSPIVNPAFVISNWGEHELELWVNGEKLSRGPSFRYGFRTTMTGTDCIVWLDLQSEQTVHITLEKQIKKRVQRGDSQ